MPFHNVTIRCFFRESILSSTSNILGIDGKVLVRASGTEPLVRVTISCEIESDLDNYMELIVSTINSIKEEV